MHALIRTGETSRIPPICQRLSKVLRDNVLHPLRTRNRLLLTSVTIQGVLVECDPSIKAIILKIDQERHDFIVEDLDDQTLVVKESQLQRLKVRLEDVRGLTSPPPEPGSARRLALARFRSMYNAYPER